MATRQARGPSGQAAGSGGASAVSCVALDPESRRAATGHADGSVSIWEVDSAESHTTLALHSGPVTSVLFASGGRQVITASDDRTVRISALGGETPRTIASSPRVMRIIALCAVAERPFAVLLSFDRHVLRVLDLGGAARPAELRDSGRQFCAGLFSHDGTVLALTETGALEVWAADERAPRVSIESGLEAPLRLAVPRAGTPVVVADARGWLKAWDLGNSTPLFQVRAHHGAIRSLAIDECGSYLASVGEDGSVRVASARTGDALAEWNARRDVACCAVTSDLSVHEAGYRLHAGTRAPAVVVVGTDAGDVEFIECGNLISHWQDRQ